LFLPRDAANHALKMLAESGKSRFSRDIVSREDAIRK
jgi:hypothetical protein